MRFVIVQNVLLLVWLAGFLWNPSPRLLPDVAALPVIGVVLCLASMLVATWAFRSLGAAFRVAPQPRPGSRLATHGVYRVLRHPMYTAVCGVALGVFLLRPTWILAAMAVVMASFYLVKAHHEEQLLKSRYGQYEEYRRGSRGVLPFRKG